MTEPLWCVARSPCEVSAVDEQKLNMLNQMQPLLSPDRVARAGEDRRAFLVGAQLLAAGDVEGAIKAFRRAQRLCEEPYCAMASVSLGECLRLQEKEGAALKCWRAIAQAPEAPPAARKMAYLSIAALCQSRQDDEGAQRALASSQSIRET